MSCFACDPPDETNDEMCPKCQAAITKLEMKYRAELAAAEGGSWEELEPRLQQAGLVNDIAESKARAAYEPHWQERLLVGS